MWRILVSVVTALGGIIVARLYSRPIPPATRAQDMTAPTLTVPADKGQDGARPRDTAERETPGWSIGVTKPGEPLRPGWSRPRPATIPRPTYWPVIAALAVTLIFWGMVTSIFIGGLGLIVLVIAAAGWIGELVHES